MITETTLAPISAISLSSLEKAQKRMRQYYQESLRTGGWEVTFDQFMVLKAIEANDLCSQVEIAEFTFKDAPTLTRILDLLQRKKLISRKKDKADRRRFLLYLTGKGKELLNALHAFESEKQQEILKGISEKELAILNIILNRVYRNIRPEVA